MRLHWTPSIRGALLLTLLFSCRASTEREEARREWHAALQELGVQPIYPPREDVQVGDIYLRRSVERGLDAGLLPLDLWLAQVDLRQTAADFYAGRSHFPDSPAATEAASPRASEGDASLSRDNRRLRQVAFPEFASMTIRGPDLEWLVPVEALAIAGGRSWQGGHEITLRIPSVESYGLPATVVLDHVTVEREGKLYLGPDVGLTHAQLMALRGRQEPGSSPAGSGEQLGLEVIREVYFARAIDISISRTSGSGLDSEISVIEPSSTDAELGAGSDVVERLNNRLERTLERSAPGASVRVIAANDASVVLRRTFQRPIAVGFRSFVLSVDPDTGAVKSIGEASHAPPQGPRAYVGQGLESSLSSELTKWFESEVGSVEAVFREDRWSLNVHPKPGETERANYLFLTRADREVIAGNLREGNGNLDEITEEQLAAFVEGRLQFAQE